MEQFEDEILELKKRVLDYSEDILEGNIVACKKMKWAMRRFLDDLNNDQWHIDWFEVYRFYRWSKLFKHTKGVLANQYIDLHISQLWEVTNILGFKKKENGYRRFREAYVQKARKNAKTQMLALVGSYISFLSDEQEEVYIAGWIKDQSKLCYNEMLKQLENADLLHDKYSTSYGKVTVYQNGSTIVPLSREARKKGDGTNPSLSIIDEYGTAHETREIVDVQKSGMVARSQPLMFYITTAGFDLNVPCYSDYIYFSEILDPELDTVNDDVFVAIYELDKEDDIKDESVWIKANPIVATYEEGINSLRSDLKQALEQPEKMRTFLTKTMNLWVDMKENGFISMDKWNLQTRTVEYAKSFMEGAHVYFGFDLSATTDLTSLGWVAVKKGEFLVGQISYMPSDKFQERMSRDKIRFDIFRDRGELFLTEGAVVDYHQLKNDLNKKAKEWGCKKVGYDTWHANLLSSELVNEGYEMVEIPQSITGLTEATKKFRENLYSGKLYHTGDKLLRWSVNNAVVQSDLNENIKISKSKSKDRIDPLAAIINAFALALYDELANNLNESILSDDWSF